MLGYGGGRIYDTRDGFLLPEFATSKGLQILGCDDMGDCIVKRRDEARAGAVHEAVARLDDCHV